MWLYSLRVYFIWISIYVFNCLFFNSKSNGTLPRPRQWCSVVSMVSRWQRRFATCHISPINSCSKRREVSMGTWHWTPLSAHRLCFLCFSLSLSLSLFLSSCRLRYQPSVYENNTTRQTSTQASPRITSGRRPLSKETGECCSKAKREWKCDNKQGK